MTARKRNQLTHGLARLALWIVIVFILVPLIWMISTSFKPEGYAQTIPPTWLFRPTFAHYRNVLSGESATPFGPLLMHSAVVSVSATVIAVVLGLLAAYALARVRFQGKK